MNDATKRSSELLHDAILNDPLIQEYNALAKAIKDNPLYETMEQELKMLQQRMVQTLNDNEMVQYHQTVNQYEAAKRSYEEDPLLHNYRVAKEEVNQLLQQINQIINEFEGIL